MRKHQIFALVMSLGLSLSISPTVQAKTNISKPPAPTVISISSSTPKKGKVNVTVTITLPISDGGSKITGSKVTAGGKSCNIAKTKTSCTIKSIKNGKALTVSAKSKNKKGFSSTSTSVAYTAGADSWVKTSFAPVVADTTAPVTQIVLPSAPTSAPTTPVPLTCAAGGTCIVGDRGPGGGIVYYVNSSGFSCGSGFTATGSPTGGLCKYLEVAPSGWNTGVDPLKDWATGSSFASQNVSGITNDASAYYNESAIGLGYKNSVAIVAQNGFAYDASSNNYAAGAARSYSGNSKSDWYLPTTAELNLLCQWNRGVSQIVSTPCTGGTLNNPAVAGSESGAGFVNGRYWSSSGHGASSAWGWQVDSGIGDNFGKAFALSVRPVRAF